MHRPLLFTFCICFASLTPMDLFASDTQEIDEDQAAGEAREFDDEPQWEIEDEEEEPREFHTTTTSSSPLRNPVDYQPTLTLEGDELQRRQGNSIAEMLDGEAGVAMRSMGPAPARPVIRGMDGDRVLILENGERMGDLSSTAHDHAVTVDPLSTQRIEVVRGPASLLYGSSALGGVVNVLNEDIPRLWVPGVQSEVAGYGATANRSGALSGRLLYGDENWATGARLTFRRAGDLETPLGPLEGSRLMNYSGNLGWAYKTGSMNTGLSIGALNSQYGLPEEMDSPLEEIELRTRRYNLQSRTNWHRGGLLENIEWRMSLALYDHKEVEMEFGPLGALEEEEIELEFLQYTASSTLTFRHGALGVLDRGALGVNLYSRLQEVGGEEALTPDGITHFLAIFLFEEILLARDLRLQFGARPELQLTQIRPNEDFPDAGATSQNVAFSGSVGLNWRPVPMIEIGTQLARAHRAPILEEMYSNAAHLGTGAYEIGDPELGNEIGHGVDAYIRLRPGPVYFELAGFYNDVSNYIFLEPTGEFDESSAFPIYRYRAEGADFLGGELSLGLDIGAFRVKSSVDYVGATRQNLAGSPLPSIPPLRTRLDVRADLARFWLGTTARYVFAQERTAPGEFSTPGYALVGADGGLRFDAAGLHILSLRVENALNATYRDHLSRVPGRDVPMAGRNGQIIYRWIY